MDRASVQRLTFNDYEELSTCDFIFNSRRYIKDFEDLLGLSLANVGQIQERQLQAMHHKVRLPVSQLVGGRTMTKPRGV